MTGRQVEIKQPEFPASLAIAILAGGESRRMGQDKALLPLGESGETLLGHTTRLARAATGGRPIWIIGRVDRPTNWPFPADLPITFLPDEDARLGPLGGLKTALKHTRSPLLVLACDLPGLTLESIQWLATIAENAPRGHGVITRNGEQWEPLFAIYMPACLPLIEARLAEGRRSLHGLIEAGDFVFVDAPLSVANALTNVNTPEEMIEWQKATSGSEGA